jgi:uncharacterized protein
VTKDHSRTPLVERFVRLSFARPFAVLLVFGLIAIAGAAIASRLVFHGSFVELLPENAKEVQDLNLVSKKAGGDGYLVVQLTGAPLDELKKFANLAAPKLETLKEVRYVEYRFDVKFFEERALWLLPPVKLTSLHDDLKNRILWEKQHANPLYVDLVEETPPPTFDELEKKYGSDAPQSEYIVSQDGKELYLFVKPTGLAGDLNFSQKLYEGVKSQISALASGFPNVKVDYTGAFRIRIEEDTQMKRDLSTASLISALVAVVLILFATRKTSALIVVGAPMMLGLSVTFAVAQLGIGHLNVVTGFLVAILIGLGIEYGIHLAMRYWEERAGLPAVGRWRWLTKAPLPEH